MSHEDNPVDIVFKNRTHDIYFMDKVHSIGISKKQDRIGTDGYTCYYR